MAADFPQVKSGECFCVECRGVFDRMSAMLSSFRWMKVPGYRRGQTGVCSACSMSTDPETDGLLPGDGFATRKESQAEKKMDDQMKDFLAARESPTIYDRTKMAPKRRTPRGNAKRSLPPEYQP